MHAFRLLAGVLLLLAALSFFGTLLCRPIRERPSPPPPAQLRGLADPQPAPLDPEELAEEQRTIQSVHDLATTLELEAIDADSAQPLPGARFQLRRLGPSGESLVQEYTADQRGRCGLRGLPIGKLWVRASAEAFFPSSERMVDYPADATRTFRFELRPAAVLRGTLRTVDGSPVAHGFLRLRPLQPPGKEEWVEVNPRGDRFLSPPLGTGVWEVAFVETPDRTPDPRLTRRLTLVPRQVRVLRVTILRPGMERDPLSSVVPGIEVVDSP